MVVRKLTGTPPAVLEQFTEVYDELLHADSQCEISIEHVDLFKAIALFEALPQGVKW
jgi:hypothetical protein